MYTLTSLCHGHPGRRAGSEGDLRLVRREDGNGFATGALQIFHDGAFGAICSNSFNEIAADVACRQLGFLGGTIAPNARSSLLQGPERDQLIKVHVQKGTMAQLSPVQWNNGSGFTCAMEQWHRLHLCHALQLAKLSIGWIMVAVPPVACASMYTSKHIIQSQVENALK